jgi:hypothetical protein
MTSHKTETPSIRKVFNTTAKSLKNHPALFVPFVIFALLEFIALIILYFAVRMPLRLIFGPAIKTFWGERFLHYPLNFLLLPKLASFARMGLSILFASLLTGMAVAIVLEVYHKKQINLQSAFKSALKSYANLFIVVFIFTTLFYFSVKIITIVLIRYFMAGHSRLLFLKPEIWLGPVLMAINFLIALLIQAAFIYAIPILIIEKEKLVKAIIKSLLLFKKLFVPTLILVGLPMLFYIPVIVLEYNSTILIGRTFPEIILWVLSLGTIVSSLVVDPLVTISTAVLYLMYREGKQ